MSSSSTRPATSTCWPGSDHCRAGQLLLVCFSSSFCHWITSDTASTELNKLNCINNNSRSFKYAAPCLCREWTPHWSSRASSDTVSCTFTYHTWQLIIFTIFTITACIFSYSLNILFWTQDLALQQILSSIDLFLSYRTDYTDSRTI